MGTNYYLFKKSKVCAHCGRSDEDSKTHIGKSSAGWRFHFNGLRVPSVAALRQFVSKEETIILDEYNNIKTPQQFFKFIAQKQKTANSGCIEQENKLIADGEAFKDDEGYIFFNREFS